MNESPIWAFPQCNADLSYFEMKISPVSPSLASPRSPSSYLEASGLGRFPEEPSTQFYMKNGRLPLEAHCPVAPTFPGSSGEDEEVADDKGEARMSVPFVKLRRKRPPSKVTPCPDSPSLFLLQQQFSTAVGFFPQGTFGDVQRHDWWPRLGKEG